MRRSVLILLTLLVLIGGIGLFMLDTHRQNDLSDHANPSTSTTNFQEWHIFNSPVGDFTVMVPTLPQHVNEKLVDPKTKEPKTYDMYVAERKDGSVFMINVISFPGEPVNQIDEQTAQTVVNDMLASNPENKLKSMKIVESFNTKALDFSIENTEYFIDGKVFMLDKTLYVLASLSKRDLYNPKEFSFFFNSFKPLDKNTHLKQK